MNPRYPLSPGRRLATALMASALVMTASATAAAQYQWRDAQGRMVYSDQPPPASVPASRVVKAPAVSLAAVPDSAASRDLTGAGGAPNAGAPPAGAPHAAAPPAQSIADRELAFRKRLAERAEEENKSEEAAARKLELAKACSDAQGDIRSLESGQRISRITPTGVREFVSDRERGERLETARKSVRERC